MKTHMEDDETEEEDENELEEELDDDDWGDREFVSDVSDESDELSDLEDAVKTRAKRKMVKKTSSQNKHLENGSLPPQNLCESTQGRKQRGPEWTWSTSTRWRAFHLRSQHLRTGSTISHFACYQSTILTTLIKSFQAPLVLRIKPSKTITRTYRLKKMYGEYR
ncbi:hypothetical protein BDQ17DRAFT_812060 [Cyathus striatus]|nr:hypothetical protein BDQ17DRAFT_812060 [Cyathus striatus]